MAQIIFNLSIILLLIPINVFADSLTLTTYYPAPHGAYDRLRLVPRAAIGGTSCSVGMMFVNANDGNKLYICADDAVDGEWQPLVGSWAQQDSAAGPNVIIEDDAEGDPIYVGIGVSDPSARLEVQGEGNSSDTSSLAVSNSSDKTILLIRDDGNVGIGTTAPTSSLYVVGSGTTSATTTLNITNSTNNSLLFARDDGNVGIGTTVPTSRLHVVGRGTTSTTSSLNIADSGGNSQLFIRDDGRIGIGTTNPSFDLHIDRDQNNALSSDWSSLYVDTTANPPNIAGANNHSAGFFYAYGPSAFMAGRSLNGVVGHAYTGTTYTGSANGVMGTVAATLTNNLSTGIGVSGLFSSSGSTISSPTVFRAYGVKGAVSLSNLILTNDTAGVLGQASGSTNSSAPLIGVKGSVDPGGTVNTAAGIYSAGVNVGGGVTTNAYSIYAFQPTESGGVITNAYTLYIKSPTDANTNYALYQEGNANNVFNGNVGIGTTAPSTKLEVNGQVKITGGTPGANKVLTSNAAGLASWQTPAGGGGDSFYATQTTDCTETNYFVNHTLSKDAFYLNSGFKIICTKVSGGDSFYATQTTDCTETNYFVNHTLSKDAFYLNSGFNVICTK